MQPAPSQAASMKRSRMQKNYWHPAVQARLTRRRALQIVGGAGAAALLAACGSGSQEKSMPAGDPSGLITRAVDTSRQARRGGTYVINLTADPQHLDPQVTLNGSARAYSLLLNQRSGH